MLAQALSNVVTSNENLMTILWELYTTLPEDQIILLCVLLLMGICTYTEFARSFTAACCLFRITE